MRRSSALVAASIALLLAAGVGLVLRLSGRALPAYGEADPAVAVGVFHVHSELSHDCDTPLAEVVRAAQASGLDFVVLDDHNEQHAGPMVREGVTLLSYAELSTPFGHVIGLGSPHVLAKEARREPGLLHGIRAQGGVPVLTHPSDAKRPWSGPQDGAGGLEIVNLAASTRRLGGPGFIGLLPMLAALPLNPHLAISQLYDRDAEALAAWDRQPDPGFVGLCGVDAHDWLALEPTLRAWNVVLTAPLPLAEALRAPFVLDELLQGRFTCSAGLLGGPLHLRFAAHKQGAHVAGAGESVTAAAVDRLSVSLATSAPGLRLVLLRDGEAVATSDGRELEHRSPAPGTYRVEVFAELPTLVTGERTTPVVYSGRIRLTGDGPMEAPP